MTVGRNPRDPSDRLGPISGPSRGHHACRLAVLLARLLWGAPQGADQRLFLPPTVWLRDTQRDGLTELAPRGL